MDRSVTAAQREIRKTVSVLFCDVTGSTALGERHDPETLRRVMDRYFERMESVVTAHGGTVEKFIGDAVMAVFGIPRLHEDDAMRAVRAAGEMRRTLVELNDDFRVRWGIELSVRIGVNTGEVVTGTGDAGRTLVTGDTVNVAARLEQMASPGEILLGVETYRLTAHAITAEPVDALVLKGKGTPVDAFRLLDVEPGITRAALRLDSPMVGRDRQLRLLSDTLAEVVADRACYLVTIVGPAGIGKTRLALEFLDGVQGAMVLNGRCLPYGEGITFWPIAEMVRAAAGISDADTAEEARTRIFDLLEGAGDRDVVGMHLSRLIGLSSGPRAEPGWALRRLLEALAQRAPVIAVFDDIHWAEPALIEAIGSVAALSREAPILLLCLTRPEFLDDRSSWGAGLSRVAAIHLEPLTETDARTMLERLVGDDTIDDEIADRIHHIARGNPLFVEQMLAMLLEEGAIVRKDDRWVTTADLHAIGAPTAISALLSARLELLSDEERSALSCASVIGELFERREVRAVVPDALRTTIDGCLDVLVRKDLIRPSPSSLGDGGETYRFRHILIREVAYDAMPKHARSLLHERFADWVERTAGERLPEVEEIVGYHLEQAYRYREELGPVDEASRALAARAAARLASAGRRVHDTRLDVDATVKLLSRARDLAPSDSTIRLEIGPDLALALVERGDLQQANIVADESIEASEAAGDRVAEARAKVARWLTYTASDPRLDLNAAEADANDAITLLGASADERGAARAWQLKASIRWALTDYGGRMAASERAAVLARRAHAGWDEAEAMANVVWGLLMGDVPLEECRDRFEAVLGTARSSGNRRLEADALACLGSLAGDEGKPDLARTLIGESDHLYLELGRTTQFWGNRSTMLGEMEWCLGNLSAAESILREGYEALGELGETGFRSSVAVLLGLVLADQGRSDEALRLADEAEALGGPWDLVNLIVAGITRAKVCVMRGRPHEAIDEAERAVEIAERGDDLRHKGLVRLALAEALHAAGKDEEAVAAARAALDRFERKGLIVLADHARAFIARIGS